MAKILMQPMGLRKSLVFGLTLLLCVATYISVPALTQTTGLPMVVSWFICGGMIVFLPLFVAFLCSIGLRAILYKFPMPPLTDRRWIFAAWVPLFLFNILGEVVLARLHFSSTRISIQTIYLVRSRLVVVSHPFEVRY